MKPLRVRMQAFGPYAGEQLVDFADLGRNRFFLITGPTGSGKTSVLDAMAYALYGETTSGAAKDGGRAGADMRSQHAPAHLLTEVEFTFAVGSDTYRVYRRPEQERPRRRGEGTAVEQQQAELWRIDPAADGSGDCREVPLASGWSAVTRRAEEILGFRAEQFRQVVMLPQGRFQELLRSDSRGREEILAKLFDTAFYARIESALKDRAAEINRAYRLLGERRGVVLDQIGVASPEELRAEQSSAAAAAGEGATAAAACAAALAAAQQALADAQTVADRLDAAEREARTLEALRERTGRVEEQRAQLQAARRAEAVAGAAEAAELRDAERATQELRLLEAREALRMASEAATRAEACWTAEEARGPERDHAAEELRRLRALEPVVESLAVLRGQVDDAAQASASATLAAGEAAQAAAAVHERRLLVQTRLAAAEQADGTLAGLEQLASEAAEQAGRRRELDQAGRAFGDAQELAASAAAAARQAEDAYVRAVGDLAALEEAWARGQASVLAAGLAPGEPCPVCGSTEHPLPAAAARVPGEADVLEARSARDEALSGRDGTSRAALEAEHAADQLARQVEQLAKTLGAGASASPGELHAAAQQAASRFQAAQDAAAAAQGLREELQAAQAAAEEAARRRDELGAGQNAAVAADQKLRVLLEERSAGVPRDCADPAGLGTAIAAAHRRREELDAAAETARAAAHRAQLQLSGAEADVRAAETAVATAAAAAGQAAEAFAGRLVEQGFADEAAWREACCPSEAVDELEENVTRFDAELAAATARLDQAAEAAQGLVAPDMVLMRQTTAAAQRRAEEAGSLKARLDARVDALRTAAAQLDEIEASSRDLQCEYEVVGQVADVATGSNRLHLNFQRFVLGAFLDRVLEVASRRLRLMSSERYELQRTESSRGHGRAAGLELVVFDGWTGYARPVSTLSGGETFLAALALALGLAEVVQSYSGGIRLDTVFVDEGFGSLDDEALDLAVQALVALQDGGRLVGIISHVAELRERIDARLEVTAGKTGSVARFVVP